MHRSAPLLFTLLLAAAPAAAPHWHTPHTTTAHTLDFAKRSPDQGVTASTNPDGSLTLSVTGVPYSDLHLTDPLPYTPAGVVRIEIPTLDRGDVTLQAVCLDATGDECALIDLIENVGPGSYEIPLNIFRTPLKNTRTFTLRLWLAGDHPTGTVAGIWYGTTAPTRTPGQSFGRTSDHSAAPDSSR